MTGSMRTWPALLLAGVFFLGCESGATRPPGAAGTALAAASEKHAPGTRPAWIIFASNRSGQWRIWMIHPDGTGLRSLTEPARDEQDVDPAFSPDGRGVLFTSTRGGKVGIWRTALDGARCERICDGDQAEWSPDGTKIVFRLNERIVTRDLAGGKETILTPANFPHCSGPSWSPEGGRIAFACRWDGGNGLYVVDARAGAPTKVYDKQGACEPHWSPDGTRIAYETETNICTISPDGTKNRLVTYYGGVQRYARWSPDGKSLVFCQAASPSDPWELYVVPAEGGEAKRLTQGGSDMYPDWK